MDFENNTVMVESSAVKYHGFNLPKNKPIIIVPPHAGRHPNVVQRLINQCVNAGWSPYVLELKGANNENKNISIEDLINFIHDLFLLASKNSGYSKLPLCGVCQGGWLSAIYSAMLPHTVSKLALMATPIDVEADPDNHIVKSMRYLSMEWFKYIVTINNGIQPGINQWMAFAMSNPIDVFFGRHVRMAGAILTGDEDTVKKLHKNNEWYDHPQNLSGNWFLWAIDNIFKNNKLIKGTAIIDNKYIDLSKINQPLFLYAGKDDNITSPQQLFSIINHVSSTIIYQKIFDDCGHTKVFVGSSELTDFKNTFLAF